QRALLLPPVGWPLYLITLKPLLYHRINGGGGEIRTRGPASRAMPVSTGDTEADLSCRSLSCWNRPEGALAGPEPLDNNPEQFRSDPQTHEVVFAVAQPASCARREHL